MYKEAKRITKEKTNVQEVAVMHILAFILMFVVGSISAACDGDFSGVKAIGKFIGYAALIIGFMFLLTQPVLLVIAIVILVVIVMCSKA